MTVYDSTGQPEWDNTDYMRDFPQGYGGISRETYPREQEGHMKLCIDCKHVEERILNYTLANTVEVIYRCLHPNAKTRNLVNGSAPLARTERASEGCGYPGRLFEAK